MQSNTVSFVIPAMNEERCIAKVIERIQTLSLKTGLLVNEIVVVDSGSTDRTRDIAVEMGCKVIEASPGNVSASRNIGASHCTGELLAFIDADALLPVEWLDECFSALIAHNAVAVGSGITINPETDSWVEKTWCELAYKSGVQNVTSKVEWLATINILVWRDAFVAISGFREDLVTCEDVDFGQRLSERGALYRIQGSVDVVHLGESKTVSKFFRREAWRARGEVILLKKRWANSRDLLSFFLPMLVVLSQLAGVVVLVALLVTMMQEQTAIGAHAYMVLASSATLVTIPVFFLVLLRRTPPAFYARAWFLLSIYFWARSIGVMRKFSRVEH